MTCPSFVGLTDNFRGQAGPHMLPDRSEVLYGGWDGVGYTGGIYRWAYPALGSPIEFFATDETTFTSMCISDVGTLYYMTNAGEIFERTDPTSAGTESLLVDIGPTTVWTITWSPSRKSILAVGHDTNQQFQIWEIETDGSTTPFGLVTYWAGPTGPQIAGTNDGGLWIARGGVLYRYDIGAGPIATLPVPIATDLIAVTHDGRCLIQSVDPTEISVVDATMGVEVVTCPALYTGDYSLIQGGTMDPTGAPFSLMSIYTGTTGDVGDEIWKWPGPPTWRVGSVGWSA